MRIVARKILRECWNTEPDSRSYLQAWYVDLKQVLWASQADVVRTHRNVGRIPSNRLAFLLNRSGFRVVVSVNYALQLVYIHFAGPHWKADPIPSLGQSGSLTMSESIMNDAEYLGALQALEAICGPNPPPLSAEEVEKLIQQVMAYEDKHYTIPEPGRFEGMAYFLESRGLTPKDLEP